MASNEWIGVIATTAPRYLKGAEDLTMRKRLILARIKNAGRISLNEYGESLTWDVEFKHPTVTPVADGAMLDYARINVYRQLSISWRGYYASDLMTEKEEAMNKGPAAIVRRYDRIKDNLIKSITNNFAGELYKDGNASGRENTIHGVESFMGEANSAAGNRISTPDDAYAGVNTDLADQGGSWTTNLSTYPNSTLATDWPDGSGDPEYDHVSPKLLNWSSTAWGTGTTTWEDNCWRVLSQGITWMTLLGGQDSVPTDIFLAGNLMQGYKNFAEAKQRIMVPHKGSVDLGFENVWSHEGVAISAEYDCPANTGYFFNVNQMKICSLMPQLFYSKGPVEDMRTGSYLWRVGFWGNARWNPKHFLKLKNYA